MSWESSKLMTLIRIDIIEDEQRDIGGQGEVRSERIIQELRDLDILRENGVILSEDYKRLRDFILTHD